MIVTHKRIVDRKAIAAARKPFCENCGRWGTVHVHHVKSKASGGSDELANLVSLCPICHTLAHTGQISKETLREIVRRRESGNIG
jgi:5-methylcytosine-specific restriction endonuclease McrA